MQSKDSEKTPPNGPGGSVDAHIAPAARKAMREAIEEYGGVEVFFVGHVDDSGIVIEAEPFAFGNQDMVPVIEQVVAPGDLVIHNHPGGDLEPSDADIGLASHFGNSGVGSYIVDNVVSRIRVIVPLLAPRQKQALNLRKLEALLLPEGPLAKSMAQYEYRPQQIEMLQYVARAFNDDGIAVVEAGTGTGKSLAYLLPAIHWAIQNGEKVIISTNTINLQEQLIRKDLPFLEKRLGLKFKAELMKGRANYLCKRRAGFVRQAPDIFLDDPQTEQMAEILAWAGRSRDGSLSDLGFIPDFEVWEQVACDADNCSRVKCRHYSDCFFFMARRRAAAADIIVANHHLVMADLAVRRDTGNFSATAVLPAYKRIVFDEAHNIEDVATQYFGICVTRRSLGRILGRLVSRDRSNHGLLPFLRDQMAVQAYRNSLPAVGEAVELLETKLIPMRQSLNEAIRDMMDDCVAGVEKILNERAKPGRELRLRVTPPVESLEFWRRLLADHIRRVANMMNELGKGLLSVRSALLKLPEAAREDFENAAGELNSLANRLESHANQFRNFHSIGKDRCRWIEVRRTKDNQEAIVRLYSLPLDVQTDLNQCVFAKTPSVVMTSATLSVNRQFDFFLGQVGLDREHAASDNLSRVDSLQLETPFDFERQAFVGVPVDFPEPRDPAFNEAACEFLLPALQISQGSAFLLFTSYSQLEAFYRRLEPMLRPLGFSCLRQGSEDRQSLLKRFKNDRTSILFATSSFWEGVDVPGDALRLLVLAKLPFRVPTDPLVQARIERLEANGEDAFNAYSVPQAVIKFKQGFGRLIRTREDSGAVIVLDKRVSTKPYGRVFLNSLPSRIAHQKPRAELLRDLAVFFGKHPRKPTAPNEDPDEEIRTVDMENIEGI